MSGAVAMETILDPYEHLVTCSFNGYSSFLFLSARGLACVTLGLGLGLGFAPLFPFWRAGRPVWKHSTGGSSIIFPLVARGPRDPAYYFCCICSCYGARPTWSRLLFLLYLFLLWCAARPWSERSAGAQLWFALVSLLATARAGPLSICLSCFIAPAMAYGLSSERALRRRPSSHFPLCLISALPTLCVSELHGRGGGGDT